ncbi:MAG: ATP-binding protein [Bacteroidota bacterium]
MKLLPSFRSRFFILFIGFANVILLLTLIFNHYYLNQVKNLNKVSQGIQEIHAKVLKDQNIISAFFRNEIDNPAFFRNENSFYIKKHQALSHQREKEIRDLKKQKTVQDLNINNELDSLKIHLDHYQNRFSKIKQLILERGFKDYGTEGKMREYVHQLEKFQTINQTNVLSLRRHEKDYIIRHDPVYIQKLNQLAGKMHKDINNNPTIPAKQKDTILNLIKHYQDHFNQMVQLDQKIGINANGGLKANLDKRRQIIEQTLNNLLIKTAGQKNKLKQKHRLIYILFYLFLVAVVTIVSIYLSKHMAGPLNKFTHYVTSYIKKESKKETPAIKANTREMQKLYESFNNLMEKLHQREMARIQAESTLLQNEINFRELTDMLPLSVYEADQNGLLTYVNKAWQNNFGYAKKDIQKGVYLYQLFLKDDENVLISNDKNNFYKESQAIRKNGSRFSAVIYSSGVISKSKIKKIRGVIIDQTERKRYIKALEKEKQRAEKSDKLKSAFLANMSHEIRTPMNAIIGFSDLLNNPELFEEERQEYHQIIKQNSDSLLKLIDDIIDIAKIEAGELVITKTPSPINQLIKELLTTYKQHPLVINNGLDLQTSCDADDQLAIHTDYNRLKQVLINLINNALKFTEEGYIKFGYKLKPDHISFFVEDSGIGIPHEEQNEIFKNFRQVNQNMKHQHGGTGLGLAISKNIVQLLGGNIWVESEAGQGTCFRFTIPYLPVQKDQLAPETTKQDETLGINFNFQGYTILIAEDDESNFSYLAELLKHLNFRIIRAFDGQEAVDLSLKYEIDLILMDIQMPVLNGYQATRKIKKINPELPIIAQTGYVMADEKEACMQAGCDDYLSKPIRNNQIIQILKQYLHNVHLAEIDQ